MNNARFPFADFNGMEVVGSLGGGGFSEVTVVPEEFTVPIFTDIPPAQLANISCVGSCGLGAATTMAPVEVASDVVVLGAGVVGMTAIQGARIKGASQIIAVEPIRYRRELALKLGATAAVDPNAEGDGLVQKLKDMCTSKVAKMDRRFAGGGYVGPDYVIEAVGGDRMPPKTERGPDPTGVLPLQQGGIFSRRSALTSRPASASPGTRMSGSRPHSGPTAPSIISRARRPASTRGATRLASSG